jgi:peptidoglycan/xylan/chitin deacetylase (PgdA/CDA1 family)
MRHPQLFAAFIVSCLLVAAWGNFAQAQPPVSLERHATAQLKGAAIVRPPVLPTPDCTIRPCIALTFDDGPDRATTPVILDVLARQQVVGTFFLVGREVPGHEDLVRRIYQEGHELGNHTWNHADMTKLSPAAIKAEWQHTQAAIVRSGVPAPQIFRPPYGAVNPSVRSHMPLTIVRWDVDTQDWMTRDPAKITEHLLHDTHPGAIVLMHDTIVATTAALEPAILELKQHYQLVTVSHLLGLQAGDQGQYFSR